jgi:hypothetical protein
MKKEYKVIPEDSKYLEGLDTLFLINDSVISSSGDAKYSSIHLGIGGADVDFYFNRKKPEATIKIGSEKKNQIEDAKSIVSRICGKCKCKLEEIK